MRTRAAGCVRGMHTQSWWTMRGQAPVPAHVWEGRPSLLKPRVVRASVSGIKHTLKVVAVTCRHSALLRNIQHATYDMDHTTWGMQHPTCQCSAHQRRQRTPRQRSDSRRRSQSIPWGRGTWTMPAGAPVARPHRPHGSCTQHMESRTRRPPVLQLQCQYPAVPQPLAGGRERSDLPSADRCRLRFGVCVKLAESSLVAAGTTKHVSVALSRTKAPRRVDSSLTARLMTRWRGGNRLAFLVRKALEHTTPLLEARRSVCGRDDLVDHSNAIDVTGPSTGRTRRSPSAIDAPRQAGTMLSFRTARKQRRTLPLRDHVAADFVAKLERALYVDLRSMD